MPLRIGWRTYPVSGAGSEAANDTIVGVTANKSWHSPTHMVSGGDLPKKNISSRSRWNSGDFMSLKCGPSSRPARSYRNLSSVILPTSVLLDNPDGEPARVSFDRLDDRQRPVPVAILQSPLLFQYRADAAPAIY